MSSPPASTFDRTIPYARVTGVAPQLGLEIFIPPDLRVVAEYGSVNEARTVARAIGLRFLNSGGWEMREPLPELPPVECTVLRAPPAGVWACQITRSGLEFWRGSNAFIGRMYADEDQDMGLFKQAFVRLGVEFPSVDIQTRRTTALSF
jgi:hypothetical protein